MKDLVIDKQKVLPGESKVVQLNVSSLPSDTKIDIKVHVFRSEQEGPTALVLAGVHGDEINGIEIARRLLHGAYLDYIQSGSLIVIPLLNVYGFINFDRYVPDGKDVNRSFPGTLTGSLASRIARTLTKYVLPNVDYIFDFHTGGDSRFNYPQIRHSKTDKEASELARIFNTPFIIESGIIVKSLRKVSKDLKIPTLVYEGGESVRLNGHAIERGIQGLLNCLRHLNILNHASENNPLQPSIIIRKTSWVRASQAGIFIWTKASGTKVLKGEKLGTISDIHGQRKVAVIAKRAGYIIGHNNASVVNEGDALFHIGYESEIVN
ncbi:MAG: succinylglutamate desuccinylase/aspartoacylase family protein [Saprospiraceae bacterium]|nr:succinylglutamate desuccinylase/aspartoacylase family protein [Saprospiraceae bacterium]